MQLFKFIVSFYIHLKPKKSTLMKLKTLLLAFITTVSQAQQIAVDSIATKRKIRICLFVTLRC